MEYRTVETLKSGKWEITPFLDLKTGDIFRMFEPTGEPVVDPLGNAEFFAESDTYINQDGLYSIDIR